MMPMNMSRTNRNPKIIETHMLKDAHKILKQFRYEVQ